MEDTFAIYCNKGGMCLSSLDLGMGWCVPETSEGHKGELENEAHKDKGRAERWK